MLFRNSMVMCAHGVQGRENTRGEELNGYGGVRTPRAQHLTPSQVPEEVVLLELVAVPFTTSGSTTPVLR